MSDEGKPAAGDRENEFPSRVEAREKRKLRARRGKRDNLWFGLGTFGMVGWSVAAPTILGAFLGGWIDSTWPGRRSWTLTLLFAGLVAGCVNAWFWVRRQREMLSEDLLEPPGQPESKKREDRHE